VNVIGKYIISEGRLFYSRNESLKSLEELDLSPKVIIDLLTQGYVVTLDIIGLYLVTIWPSGDIEAWCGEGQLWKEKQNIDQYLNKIFTEYQGKIRFERLEK